MRHQVQDIPPSVVRAISEVQTHMSAVAKDGRNGHGGYDFASTDAIYAALSVKMGQAGLTMLTLEEEPEIKVIDTLVKENRKIVMDKDGNPVTEKKQWCRFKFTFVLATEEGTWTDPNASRSIFIQILGPQTFMAAQSYCEKSFLRSLFKIPTGDLDLDALPADGDPKRTSSASAKRDGLWDKFQNELSTADEMATIVELEQRYTSKMPSKWKTPMYDALESKRQTLLNGFDA